jgi:hypothetical protein
MLMSLSAKATDRVLVSIPRPTLREKGSDSVPSQST